MPTVQFNDERSEEHYKKVEFEGGWVHCIDERPEGTPDFTTSYPSHVVEKVFE